MIINIFLLTKAQPISDCSLVVRLTDAAWTLAEPRCARLSQERLAA